MNNKQPSKKTSVASIIGILIVCIIGFFFNNGNDSNSITNNTNDKSVQVEYAVNSKEKDEISNDFDNSNTQDTSSEKQNSNEEYNSNIDDKSNNSESASKYSFRNDSYLTQHFEKHGNEFSYATKEEYEDGARKVITSDKALHKIEAEDGDDVYYIEETNEFVIVSTDGYIRTYFKPNDGIRYFNRQ